MPSNYKEIREKNIEEYGKGTRHLSYFADIYSTRTHFIYEILQNTEDALSRRQMGSPEGYVRFDLLKDRLEIRHNGAPFVENDSRKDVSGICGIGEGTKAGDYTQIGKFGIGFKSVYAYTFLPCIHSCDEHFEIRRFVEPYGLNADDAPAVQEGETCIVLPFDSPETIPEWAFRDSLPIKQTVQEIGDALRNLGARSLLFLRQLDEIKWTLPDGASGHFLREIKDETPSSRLVTVTDGENIEEWWVFRREDTIKDGKDRHDIAVEVGFCLEEGKVRCARNTELVAYFPTEKKTGFGFLIQAPFKTTKARDNIKSDDSANQHIIKIAAQLVADSLEKLRDLNLLDVSSYLALPLHVPEDSFFRPIYDLVRKALREKPLLPTHGGAFIKAEEAKLARGAELAELFSSEQLGTLFGRLKATWLDPSITESGTFASFHAYLVGKKQQWSREWEVEPLIGGLQVDAESLAQRLKSDFLATQDISWLIRLIGYIEKNSRIFKEKSVPIIRLENGRHVSLPAQAGQPSAYFPPIDSSGLDLSAFPVVVCQLAEEKEVRAFLEKEGVREIDELAIIEQCIIPKYQNGDLAVDEHWRDIEKIVRAYKTDSQEQKRTLKERLQTTAFILAQTPDPGITAYRKPNELYFPDDELKMYFSGNNNVGFVSSDYEKAALEMFKDLGVSCDVRVNKEAPNHRGFINIKDRHSSHERGLNGFDPGIRADGLDYALNSPFLEKSLFIWNRIAIPNYACIRGMVEKSTRQTYENSSKEIRVSNLGRLLIEKPWLPGLDGKCVKPEELRLDDLPESFIRDEKLADQLGMKKDVVAKLAEQVGVQAEDIDLLKKHPKEFQEWKAAIAAKQEKPLFPIRTVADPERRQERLSEKLGDASEKEYEKRERSVRITRGTVEPSLWLKNQYTNEVGQMICQICEEEMPFRKRDGEYYFEAVEAFSLDYFGKEHEAQFLALCPLCAAMYNEFIKKDEDAMEAFKDALLNADKPKVSLQFGDSNTSIRFVESHYIDIKTILSGE